MREELFHKYKNLIYKQAWKYSKAYNLEVCDLISEAYLIYEDATKRHREEKGSFSTFLTHRLRKLNDYCHKETKTKSQQLSFILDKSDTQIKELENQKENIQEFESILSYDAKKIIQGIFLGTLQVMNPIRQTKPNLHKMGKILEEKWGWKKSRTEKIWREINLKWKIVNA